MSLNALACSRGAVIGVACAVAVPEQPRSVIATVLFVTAALIGDAIHAKRLENAR